MKTQIEPRTGQIFLCIKNNKQHSAVKGKYYLYDSGELKTYTSRNVTLLANGDEMLEIPGVFELVERCPFCGAKLYARCGCGGLCDSNMPCPMADSAVPRLIHDTVECAAEWDARVKKYCRDCNGDTVNGKCPKCDEAESANEPSQGGSHDVDASVFLDGPGITKCDYCGLPFAPLYDGDRICSECRKKGSEDND